MSPLVICRVFFMFFSHYSQCRVDSAEENIMRAREGFRVIAQRGAICFDCTQYLREIDPIYQTSFLQFLDLYDSAISHSDRSVHNQVCGFQISVIISLGEL